MTIEAGEISAIRFSKEQEAAGLDILVQHLGRVDCWPGGFKQDDPCIVTVPVSRLNGVLDQLRQAQIGYEEQKFTGEIPVRAQQLWERLQGWEMPRQDRGIDLIDI